MKTIVSIVVMMCPLLAFGSNFTTLELSYGQKLVCLVGSDYPELISKTTAVFEKNLPLIEAKAKEIRESSPLARLGLEGPAEMIYYIGAKTDWWGGAIHLYITYWDKAPDSFAGHSVGYAYRALNINPVTEIVIPRDSGCHLVE